MVVDAQVKYFVLSKRLDHLFPSSEGDEKNV